MKAILVETPGGVEQLRLVDQPVPEPGPGHIRVRLGAIGLNFADVMGRRGEHPGIRQPPVVLGCEGAGVVDAIGPGVTQHQVGDRVGIYSPFCGSYAEWMTVPEGYALPLPASVPDEDAAAFTHVYLTAWHCLVTVGRATAGERLFVSAAAGGVGIAVLQLGRALGLEVIGGVGSDEKLPFLASLGFDRAFNYRRDDAVARLLELTDGRGLDLAVDTVAGPLFHAIEESLAPLGRLVTAGLADRIMPQPDVGLMLGKCSTYATMNLSIVFRDRIDIVRPSWDRLMGLYEAGLLTPHIGARFPLAEVGKAHTLMESRASTGKILLLP